MKPATALCAAAIAAAFCLVSEHAPAHEAVAVVSDVSKPDDALLSPAEYFTKPAYRQMSLSPNGRYFAFVEDIPFEDAYAHYLEEQQKEEENSRKTTISLAGETYGEQILIYDLQERKFLGASRFYEHEIYWTHWSNDDRILLSVSTRFGLNFGRRLTIELPAARTLSVDWRTQDSVMLFENDRAIQRQNLTLSNVVDPLPLDPDHVLMSAYKNGDLDLWKVNVLTGDSTRVATGRSGTFAWLTDRKGEPAFRMDQNRSGTVMHVFASKPSGGWEKIATAPLNQRGESHQFWPIAKGDGDNEIYVLATSPDEDKAVVKIFDLGTGALGKTIASTGGYDIGGGIIDQNTAEYIGAWYYDDRYRTILKDKALQRHVDALNRFFDDDANVRLIGSSRESSKLIVAVSSPTIAGDIYVYDYEKQEIEPLFSVRSALIDRLSPVEIVRYRSRNGLTLTGYLTHPRGMGASAPAPLVLMPHGGPAVRDVYDFDPTAQFLAERGYRVFQPNFRGSSGYGAAFRKAGDREWGGAMHDDLIDGLAHLEARGLAGRGRVCILGASYGGYAALYAAMAAPERFACAVSMAGVSDLPNLLEHERKDPFGGADAFNIVVEQIGDPKKDRALLEARSPARHVERLKTPLLIIHGKQDQVVPYSQSYDLMKALDKAKIEYDWLVLDDGHNFSKLSSNVQSMRKIEEFLGKHLKH